MRRLLLVSCLMLASALPALATDFSSGKIAQSNTYRDLPGVKPPKAGAGDTEADYKCRTEIDDRRLWRRDIFDNGTGSAIIYNCAGRGWSMESDRPPVGNLLPGQPNEGWPWGR